MLHFLQTFEHYMTFEVWSKAYSFDCHLLFWVWRIAEQLSGLLQSFPSGLAQHENWDRTEKRNRESMLIIS
jgi:hypothetical protein